MSYCWSTFIISLKWNIINISIMFCQWANIDYINNCFYPMDRQLPINFHLRRTMNVCLFIPQIINFIFETIELYRNIFLEFKLWLELFNVFIISQVKFHLFGIYLQAHSALHENKLCEVKVWIPIIKIRQQIQPKKKKYYMIN